MLDPFTLDQLRTLVAVVEEGTFSGAGRKLQRVQSAISLSMANLEAQLGVAIWDRSTKVASLTEEGKAVLVAARRICVEVDALKRVTSGLSMGLEASVSLCVDQLLPVSALVALCKGFSEAFPDVDLRVDTQTMSAVSSRVLAGTATLGVVSPLGMVSGVERKVLTAIKMVPVVGARHPLAARPRGVSTASLADHVQLVLSERDDDGVPDQGVLSPRTWRIADLHTKHAMLRAGLGWGNLPEHLVHDDLRRGRLVRIHPEAWAEDEHTLFLSAIYRSDATFGPAHRWVIDALTRLCARAR